MPKVIKPIPPQFLKRYLLFENLPTPITAPFVPEKIHITNPSLFVEKINKLRYSFLEESSKRSIQIISDFDYTITKYRHDNKICDATFGIWKRSPEYLPEKFLEQLSATYAEFGPYETDATISFEEKTLLIQQLYRLQLSCFQKYRITENMVQKVLANANIVFRSQTVQFLQTLQMLNIPLYIISGGISDAIYNTIRALAHKNFTNISIHSNQLESYTFSMPDQDHQFADHVFVRFKMQQIIHSFNKYKVMNHMSKRKNCVLMGDLVSDIYMAEGNNYDTILSIFYGKEGENDQRALAENKFDIIVEGDCSHRIIIELLKVIYQQPQIDWKYLYNTNKKLPQLLI